MIKEIKELIVNYAWEKSNTRIMELEDIKKSNPSLFDDVNYIKKEYLNCMNAITSKNDFLMLQSMEKADLQEELLADLLKDENAKKDRLKKAEIIRNQKKIEVLDLEDK